MTGGELVSKYFLTMARPQQFDNEALLESMRETFLDLGPGASTQELAKRAGVQATAEARLHVPHSTASTCSRSGMLSSARSIPRPAR